MKDSKKFKKDLFSWFQENQKKYPWRTKNRNPYQILVAELMLQRTTAVSVNKIYENFLNLFPDLKSIYKTDTNEIKKQLKDLGLIKRAIFFKEIAAELKEINFEIPDNYSDLRKLKGIGDYSARAILLFGFNKKEIPIDSNIKRIVNRIASIKEVKQQREFLINLCTNNKIKQFIWALLDLGWVYCRAPKPFCKNCPLKNFCDYNYILNS